MVEACFSGLMTLPLQNGEQTGLLAGTALCAVLLSSALSWVGLEWIVVDGDG